MFDFTFGAYGTKITDFFLVYGIKIIVALLILLVGLWLIKRIVNLAYKLMVRENIDPSLRPFLRNIISVVLKIFLTIVVIGQIGVEATSFIAILGSAGLAIGLALQGSLANFAGGVLLLAIKPFKVGDYIETKDLAGTVFEINMFNTVLKTKDNKTIFAPNGPLASSTITNFDVEENRRLDMKFLIGPTEDLQKAKALIYSIMANDPRIQNDPAPKIFTEFNQTEVTLLVRVWAKREDYSNLYFDLMEKVKAAFDQEIYKRPV